MDEGRLTQIPGLGRKRRQASGDIWSAEPPVDDYWIPPRRLWNLDDGGPIASISKMIDSGR